MSLSVPTMDKKTILNKIDNVDKMERCRSKRKSENGVGELDLKFLRTSDHYLKKYQTVNKQASVQCVFYCFLVCANELVSKISQEFIELSTCV